VKDLRLRFEPFGTPEQVDGAAVRDGDQPGPRTPRHPLRRPGGDGRRKCVLEHLLGEVEVAEEANERGERTSRLLAKGALQGLGGVHDVFRTGLTSIDPCCAVGIRAARAIASSKSLASIM
jgi:hypothetical protein